MSIKSPIMGMFGPSPIKPLEQHMEHVADCVRLLPQFFQATQHEQWDDASALRDDIANLEKDADQLKRELRLHLPNNLFMPVARTDLLEMLTMQDRIANKAKDISGIVLGRKIVIPAAIINSYTQLLDCCLNTVKKTFSAISELQPLIEAGFKGSEVKFVEQMIVEIDKFEHDSDDLQVCVRESLFKIEAQLPPVEVMFLYRLIEWTGDLADLSQNVGGQLHVLIAR